MQSNPSRPPEGQLTLFDLGPKRLARRRTKKPPLEQRYREWLADHARTFALFERFARELRAAGHKRLGAKAIAERIRWEGMTTSQGEGDDAYKVPNQYVSRMVRDLIAADPSWETYFETRALKS